MIKVEQSALLPALNAVIKAVERRNTVPILGHILFEADENRLKLTATNLDMQISVTQPCFCDAPSAMALPGTILHDAVGKLDNDAQIEITFNDTHTEMKSGRTQFKLQTMAAKDLPLMVGNNLQAKFKLKQQHLQEILSKVSFAISTEETRYYLNGIHLHVEDKQLVAVATDGHRLAQLKLSGLDGLDSLANGLTNIIVPRHFWSTVKGVFASTDDIDVALSSTYITMQQGHTSIISKLIDGSFPEYKRVIPQQSAHIYYVPTANLAKALDRVMTVCSLRGRAVKFCFINNELKLIATDPDMGEAIDSVDLLDNSASEVIEIGFNGNYALDQLSACGCDELAFGLNSASEPALMKPKNNSDGGEAQFVLMPMRL